MKIYTRRGDDGTTGLLYGGRVDKDDDRTEANGTIDEAVSALGLARAHLGTSPEPADAEWADRLLSIQRELFIVGAQIATDPVHWPRLEAGVSLATEDMVRRLEDGIDELIMRYPLPQAFTVPGARPAGAAVDLGRAIVRRAERRVSRLTLDGVLPDDLLLRYLNRLSDFLFVFARAVEGGTHTPTRQD